MLFNGSAATTLLTGSSTSSKVAMICSAGVACVAMMIMVSKETLVGLSWMAPMHEFDFGAHECLDSWPPRAECVVEVLPFGLVLLLMILAINLASFLMEEPSESDLNNVKQQHQRRHGEIEEMVKELEENEDWDSDELGQVQFRKIYRSLIDLVELPNYERGTLNRGVQLAWAIFEKELRIAISKTIEGKEIEYTDGKKLETLCISNYDRFHALARREGAIQDTSEQQRIWNLVKKGRKAHRALEFEGVSKALRLLWLVRKSLGWVVVEAIVSMFAAMISAFSVYYRSEVLDNIQAGGDTFWLAVKAMVLVQLAASLLNLLTNTLEVRGRGTVARQVKVKHFEALLQRDVSWWAIMAKEDQEPKYDLYSIDDEVKSFLEIPQSIAESISTVVTHSILVLRKSSTSFYLLLFLNFGTPMVSWLLRKLTSKLRPMVMRGLVLPSFDASTWMYAIDPQYVGTFQSFARNRKECISFLEKENSWLKYEKREFLLDALEDPVMACLSTSLDAAQIHTSGRLVRNGSATLTQAQALMNSSEEVADTTKESWNLFKTIVEKAQPLARVYDLCTLPQKIKMSTGIIPSQRPKGHIIVKDVKFSYPNRNVPVLKGLTFEALPGQTIGMTGQAGFGKSSVMKLLERFYDANDGEILLDGIDIRKYDPEWLRRHIVSVSQEPVLIPTNIRDNLVFGCAHEPSLEEIHEACRAANIYDTLMDKDRFPQGLRTELDRVTNISGGERQRIAIARAVLANPPVLLLDEATASLDEENQKKVQEALDRLMDGRTTLVIAHRLSTIRNADKIITFDQGKIAESGTHEELIGQDTSLYAKLWKIQFQKSTIPTPKPAIRSQSSNPQDDRSDAGVDD